MQSWNGCENLVLLGACVGVFFGEGAGGVSIGEFSEVELYNNFEGLRNC